MKKSEKILLSAKHSVFPVTNVPKKRFFLKRKEEIRRNKKYSIFSLSKSSLQTIFFAFGISRTFYQSFDSLHLVFLLVFFHLPIIKRKKKRENTGQLTKCERSEWVWVWFGRLRVSASVVWKVECECVCVFHVDNPSSSVIYSRTFFLYTTHNSDIIKYI